MLGLQSLMGGKVKPLESLELPELTTLFQQVMASGGAGTDIPPLNILAAITDKVKAAKLNKAAQGMNAMQQAAAQPETISQDVLSEASQYASGGIVALAGGGDVPDKETVDFLDRIYGRAYGPRPSLSLEEIEEMYRKAGLRGPRNPLADISDTGSGYASTSSRVSIPVRRPPAPTPETQGWKMPTEEEFKAQQTGLESLIQKQGQVDPALKSARESYYKGQEERLSARDARSLEALKRAQEAASAPLMDNQEALLRLAGALGGAKRFGEGLSMAAKEAGAVRGEQRKAVERVQELRAQEQNALDTLRDATEAKKLADTSNDVQASRAAEMKIQESRAQLLGTRRDMAKLTQELGFKGREVAALEEKARAATLQAGTSAAALNRPERETDLRLAANIEFRALLAKGEPDNALTRQKAFDTAARKLSKGASMTRAETAQLVAANKEFTDVTNMGAEAIRLRRLLRQDPVAGAAELERVRSQIEAKYGVRPDAEYSLGEPTLRPAVPGTPMTPAAPAAKPGMPEPPKGYVRD